MSPELIDPEVFGLKKSLPTKESDCYAPGTVIYEVLGGWTPFSPCKAPAVMRKVLEDLEERKGHHSQMIYRRCWNCVGSLSPMTG